MFASWPILVHHIQARELRRIERALVPADPPAVEALLRADPDAALATVDGLAPLLVLFDALERERGADLHDRAFDTVEALLAARAPTRHTHTGDPAIDALLDEHTNLLRNHPC